MKLWTAKRRRRKRSRRRKNNRRRRRREKGKKDKRSEAALTERERMIGINVSVPKFVDSKIPWDDNQW